MPNYCYNLLTIDGDESAVSRLIEENREGSCSLSFGKLISPEEELLNDEVNGEWAKEHWGASYLKEAYPWKKAASSNTAMSILFITPWSPPFAWLNTLISKYPELSYDLIALDENQEYLSRHERSDNGEEREANLASLLKVANRTLKKFYKKDSTSYVQNSIKAFKEKPKLDILVDLMNEELMAEQIVSAFEQDV